MKSAKPDRPKALWSPGGPGRGYRHVWRGVRATDASAELGRIAATAGGKFGVKDVIAASRAPHAVLHPLFEWDNHKAGEMYRRWQARHIMTLLVSVEEDDSGKEFPVRIYHCVNDDKGESGQFKAASEIVKSIDETEILLAQAYADARQFVAKYGRIAKLAKIVRSLRLLLSEEEPD